MRLERKVAVVTGGSRGIGKEIAKSFLAEGAKVIICSQNTYRLQETAQELKKQFNDIDFYVVDVANKIEVDKMFDDILVDKGTIDIIVNNAGITEDAMIHKMTEEQWDNVINVNLKGTFNCCSAVSKIMREKQYGKIINISSGSALRGNCGQANYSASKAGIIALTKTMAIELGRNDINVNAVVPGLIWTEMVASVPEKVLEAWKESTPLKRFGQPSDVAKACVFLASDEAAFITGAVLNVTGGLI